MRAKTATLGLAALAGIGAVAAGSQPWITFEIEGGGAEQVTGHMVNAALSPVAIAVIIAALALTIAGAVFKRVLGVLVALLGAGIAALAIGAVNDPDGSIAAHVAEITGLTGAGAMSAVSGQHVSVWPWVTFAAGVLAALPGLYTLIFSGKWAVGGRKYEQQPAKKAAAGGSAQATGDRISDWDALSDGDDPTDDGADPADDGARADGAK